MRSTFIGTIVTMLLAVIGQASFAAEELYVVDVRETPGKILQVKEVSWSSNPVLRPVYTRPSAYIYTIAFHRDGPAYFVDVSHRNIYVTDGLSEKKIFSFATPLQDVDFDSKGQIHFSAIGSENGVIYRLNPQTGKSTRIAVFPIQSLANQTRGFWNGYFAFDPSDKLFLSIDGPQPDGSAIYEYDGGQLRKRFTHSERITGFTFAAQNVIYFTNSSTRVYELKRFTDLSVRHQERSGRMLNDVELVRVENQGGCTISGRLRGGRDFWQMTSVQALGPNVVWRTSPGSIVNVLSNGTYVLRNLPNGRYRVSTDIRAGTMAGFNPKAHIVKRDGTNCRAAVQNIDFTFSQ